MICIIIPTYNEKENIFKLVNKINNLKLNARIIIVDDSKNRIPSISKMKNVSYIFRGKKLGRGSAVLFGIKKEIKNLSNKIFIEMDADFSHNPNELKRNLKYFKKKKNSTF